MADLISLAEQKPPQMDEIKSKVEHAFQKGDFSLQRFNLVS